MFKLLQRPPDTNDVVTIELDGRPVIAIRGETLASLLVRQTEAWSRQTPISGSERAPYCMMGACFECLMFVENEGVVRACQTRVTDGMKACRQRGARALVPEC